MARKPKQIAEVGPPQGEAERLPVANVAPPERDEIVDLTPKAIASMMEPAPLPAHAVPLEVTATDIAETEKALRHLLAGLLRNRHVPHADGAIGKAIASLDALARIVPTKVEG